MCRASVLGMLEFPSHASPAAPTDRPGDRHPTSDLRVFIRAEMRRRMGFGGEAARAGRVWRAIRSPARTPNSGAIAADGSQHSGNR
jgi:hypothetical protein